MKTLISTLSCLVFCCVAASAAPAKKPLWEYATVDFSASRDTGAGNYRYGAELILPGKKVIFLETKDANTANYKTYLFNRLGAQSWELAFVPGDRYDNLYIFIAVPIGVVPSESELKRPAKLNLPDTLI